MKSLIFFKKQELHEKGRAYALRLNLLEFKLE